MPQGDTVKSHRYDLLFAICSLCLLFSLFIGCAGNQHTLNLTNLPRPVYMGDRITSSATIDSSRVQTIRSISCYTSHEKEGETISEGKHSTFSSGAYEHVKENILVKVGTALEKYPHRFIGNVHVVAEVDRGISLGAIFTAILGSQITGEGSDIGFYNDQSFYVTGTIYELKKDKLHNEE